MLNTSISCKLLYAFKYTFKTLYICALCGYSFLSITFTRFVRVSQVLSVSAVSPSLTLHSSMLLNSRPQVLTRPCHIQAFTGYHRRQSVVRSERIKTKKKRRRVEYAEIELCAGAVSGPFVHSVNTVQSLPCCLLAGP